MLAGGVRRRGRKELCEERVVPSLPGGVALFGARRDAMEKDKKKKDRNKGSAGMMLHWV